MIGRTVWAEPSRDRLHRDIDDAEFQRRVAANFRRLIDGWRASRAPVVAAVAEAA